MFRKNICVLLAVMFIMISCGEDSTMDTEMLAPVDITTKIIGSYKGDSKLSDGGSFFTEDQIVATIEKSTDSSAVIRVPSLSGTITFNASLNSDSTFILYSESIYSEGPFDGLGSVVSDSLTIEVSASSSLKYEFLGERQ